MVTDNFLGTYENLVMKKRMSGSWGRLFEGQDVLNAFSGSRVKVLSLRDFMEDFWSNFLPWREAVKGPGYRIPTIRNTTRQA